MKKLNLFSLLFSVFLLVSCSNFSEGNNSLDVELMNFRENESIIIGDSVIYGEEFSFNDVYETISRAAIEEEAEFVKMVYFSVQPSNYENLKKINSIFGYLNPYELNKEILQTCDPDSMIFDDDKLVLSELDISEKFNYDLKYYYFDTKEKLDCIQNELEGLTIIENFSVPVKEFIDEYEDRNDSEDLDESSSRGLFDCFSKYRIYGILFYREANVFLPVNGVRVRRYGINGEKSCDVYDAEFSLGSVSNIWTQWLWMDFSNDACLLTNIAGLKASVLLKTGKPKSLRDVTLEVKSDSANGKIAVCNEILSRYNYEKTTRRNLNLPRSLVWVTDSGDGMSSAPCFHYRDGTQKPDILITGCSKMTIDRVFTIHHEYTHFIHCVYAKNISDFWRNIAISEIYSTLSTKFDTYDFSNKYVCFTENLAEWYSYIGFNKGVCGSRKKGYDKRDTELYKNVDLFISLCRERVLIRNNENDILNPINVCEERVIDLIAKYKITTFQQFYDSLIKDYPENKKKIKSIFSSNYESYGNGIKY